MSGLGYSDEDIVSLVGSSVIILVKVLCTQRTSRANNTLVMWHHGNLLSTTLIWRWIRYSETG